MMAAVRWNYFLDCLFAACRERRLKKQQHLNNENQITTSHNGMIFENQEQFSFH